MNLILDIGNTLTKIGLYRDNKLLQMHSTTHFEEDMGDLLNGYSIKKAIVSSVGKSENYEFDFPTLYLDHETPLPISNAYKSPETLGKDRIALAVAAYYAYTGKDCLIIDAGSCITYDFIDRGGNYLGGGISPGLQMRLKALNHFTARLPLLEYEKDFSLIGGNTSQSILSGTVGGMLREVKATIAEYEERYPSVINLISGGDASVFEDLLKNSIFAPPEFLLSGLNYILEYNAERI